MKNMNKHTHLEKEKISTLLFKYSIPSIFGYKGILFAGPVSDVIAFLITAAFVYREFKGMPFEIKGISNISKI